MQYGVLQRYCPPNPKILINALAASIVRKSNAFRVEIPDSRLRVKISVIFAFKAGQQTAASDLTGGAATLWLYAADWEDAGATGTTIPVTNVEGTLAAPTAVPATPGLAGYSREFVTAADNIEGIFTTGDNGFRGNWVLQTRFQPDAGQRFTPEEWNEIVNLCKMVAPPPVIL